MLLLTRHDVEILLPMSTAMEAVAEGFRRLATGGVTMPQRAVTPIPPHHGLHLSMPAFVEGIGEQGALAVKIVTVYGDNPARRQLPTIQGVLLLHDAASGQPIALMDAEALTAIRTGAASGVATRALARPDAAVLTIFGAGAQAMAQVEAVCAARAIRQVYVVTRTGRRDAAFCTTLRARLGTPVTPLRDTQTAVEAADIICTATNSPTPLFRGEWLRPGAHINAIGAYTRTMRELDGEALRRSRIIVDHRPAAQAEAGDIVLALAEGAITEEQIAGSLGEVLVGLIPGRTAAGEITLFKSVGLAMQDAVVAAQVYARARAMGIGQEIGL
ncbi:MAG TPA: ornithine cyclodeaminase family protein [Caldilineaceae bacterium]|nr:ornithine cyclodeaminase family protein [Caldilineaceae bacterium]